MCSQVFPEVKEFDSKSGLCFVYYSDIAAHVEVLSAQFDSYCKQGLPVNKNFGTK